MLSVEIPPNPNCDAVEMRIFHDLEPPQPITHVRLDRDGHGRGSQWYAVTGWKQAGGTCPALARKVDDSGEGVVLLVSGGDAGVRLQPEGARAPWQLGDPEQWGLPFLLVGDPQDLRFADRSSTRRPE